MALGIFIFLIMRFLGIGNLLNALLIAGTIVAFEIFFTYT